MSTEAQIRASMKYNREKCDSIMIRPSKELGAKIRQAAAQSGESLTSYILGAVEEKMERQKNKK